MMSGYIAKGKRTDDSLRNSINQDVCDGIAAGRYNE